MVLSNSVVPLLGLYFLFTTFTTVNSINCYQCSGTDSANPFECTEFLDSDNALVPTNCSSIHDAQYCIKHVGRYEVVAIECFQCNSSDTMECGDELMKLDGGVIKPTPCEHVYNAQYCIKHTGGISTKRYCSSLDLGNYCNYVQQPGDKLEYRTCIYTCSTDGCNSASSLSISAIILLSGLFLLKFAL
ncbi:U-scoloptoxin(05)-Sm1a isoform X2 [Pectinophora gossypiella]|uniref:U-scoloptoxin(05)-Sm1a isoform X2 n=1 Tax=Pectinophora gossypiella TaxID=13191 RepID=UPI00214EFA8D|nr:U-scoloptoxin(05)-Sm1a isoform X2 [Pectinophora gossypiella]